MCWWAEEKLYKSKEETSSPTIHIEPLFLYFMIDEPENRNFVTLDKPEAFVKADIEKLINVKLVGELANILKKVDPTYSQFITYENGKKGYRHRTW